MVPPIAGSTPVIYPKTKLVEFDQFEYGTVAQLVERQTENLGVAGSIPAGSTIWVSRLAAMAADCKSAGFTIVGSSPT